MSAVSQEQNGLKQAGTESHILRLSSSSIAMNIQAKRSLKINAGCGFGCVLVKTDVLFEVQAAFGTMFNPFLGIGEDLAFCWRARHLGYDIWLDPSIECGHVGYSVINRSFFNAYSNAQKQKEDAENV